MTDKKTKSQDVVPWKEQMALDAVKVAKQERPASSFISMKGGVMTYQEEHIKDNKLDCVVLAYVFERTMYDRAYDADDTGPPDCFAQSLTAETLNPHKNVKEPVNPTCHGCPKAEFGTAKQGKGPACKTYRKLMVMPSSALGEEIGDAEIALLRVPPTSVKNWSNYANKIANTTGVPPWAVQTMISCAPHPKKMFEVSFDLINPIADEGMLAAIHSRIPAAEQSLLTPYTYDDEAAPAEDSDKY